MHENLSYVLHLFSTHSSTNIDHTKEPLLFRYCVRKECTSKYNETNTGDKMLAVVLQLTTEARQFPGK